MSPSTGHASDGPECGCVMTCVVLGRFAYVDFATPDAKTVAITLSENPLDGRRLLIKDGKSQRYIYA